MTAAQRPEPLDLAPIEARHRHTEACTDAALAEYTGAEPCPAPLLAEVRRLRTAMTAAEAYRDAQQRVEAVAAQHLAPTSTRLARVVPVDAVEALAARLGLLADATEIVPEVPR